MFCNKSIKSLLLQVMCGYLEVQFEFLDSFIDLCKFVGSDNNVNLTVNFG